MIPGCSVVYDVERKIRGAGTSISTAPLPLVVSSASSTKLLEQVCMLLADVQEAAAKRCAYMMNRKHRVTKECLKLEARSRSVTSCAAELDSKPISNIPR
eukprot:5121443-Amphidinium_carterae.1